MNLRAESESTSLTVAIRVRPLLQTEKEANFSEVAEIRELSSEIYLRNIKARSFDTIQRIQYRKFNFDSCFNPETSQNDLFQSIGANVFSTFLHQQKHATIIAYGQTGSGKTHTMLGSRQDPGLIPRICSAVLEAQSQQGQYSISFYEIYNGKVRDLLSYISAPDQAGAQYLEPKQLKVRQAPRIGPFVEGLSRHPLRTREDIQLVLTLGCRARSTGPTASHEASSRSHAVCSIQRTYPDAETLLPDSRGPKLHLVDLAGSEKPYRSATKLQMKESAHINRSLATLGSVILALSAREKQNIQPTHIPYRDSTLTWLLRNSLGGNAKTVMIGTVSPSESCYSETLSTLRYAYRARNIHSVPLSFIGNHSDHSLPGDHRLLVNSLQSEIVRLKRQLTAAACSGGCSTPRLSPMTRRSDRPPYRIRFCHCQRDPCGKVKNFSSTSIVRRTKSAEVVSPRVENPKKDRMYRTYRVVLDESHEDTMPGTSMTSLANASVDTEDLELEPRSESCSNMTSFDTVIEVESPYNNRESTSELERLEQEKAACYRRLSDPHPSNVLIGETDTSSEEKAGILQRIAILEEELQRIKAGTENSSSSIMEDNSSEAAFDHLLEQELEQSQYSTKNLSKSPLTPGEEEFDELMEQELSQSQYALDHLVKQRTENRDSDHDEFNQLLEQELGQSQYSIDNLAKRGEETDEIEFDQLLQQELGASQYSIDRLSKSGPQNLPSSDVGNSVYMVVDPRLSSSCSADLFDNVAHPEVAQARLAGSSNQDLNDLMTSMPEGDLQRLRDQREDDNPSTVNMTSIQLEGLTETSATAQQNDEDDFEMDYLKSISSADEVEKAASAPKKPKKDLAATYGGEKLGVPDEDDFSKSSSFFFLPSASANPGKRKKLKKKTRPTKFAQKLCPPRPEGLSFNFLKKNDGFTSPTVFNDEDFEIPEDRYTKTFAGVSTGAIFAESLNASFLKRRMDKAKENDHKSEHKPLGLAMSLPETELRKKNIRRSRISVVASRLYPKNLASGERPRFAFLRKTMSQDAETNDHPEALQPLEEIKEERIEKRHLLEEKENIKHKPSDHPIQTFHVGFDPLDSSTNTAGGDSMSSYRSPLMSEDFTKGLLSDSLNPSAEKKKIQKERLTVTGVDYDGDRACVERPTSAKRKEIRERAEARLAAASKSPRSSDSDSQRSPRTGRGSRSSCEKLPPISQMEFYNPQVDRLSVSHTLDMLRDAKLLAAEKGSLDVGDGEESIPSYDGDSFDPSSEDEEKRSKRTDILLDSTVSSVDCGSYNQSRRDSCFLSSSLNHSDRLPGNFDAPTPPEEISEISEATVISVDLQVPSETPIRESGSKPGIADLSPSPSGLIPADSLDSLNQSNPRKSPVPRLHGISSADSLDLIQTDELTMKPEQSENLFRVEENFLVSSKPEKTGLINVENHLPNSGSFQNDTSFRESDSVSLDSFADDSSSGKHNEVYRQEERFDLSSLKPKNITGVINTSIPESPPHVLPNGFPEAPSPIQPDPVVLVPVQSTHFEITEEQSNTRNSSFSMDSSPDSSSSSSKSSEMSAKGKSPDAPKASDSSSKSSSLSSSSSSSTRSQAGALELDVNETETQNVDQVQNPLPPSEPISDPFWDEPFIVPTVVPADQEDSVSITTMASGAVSDLIESPSREAILVGFGASKKKDPIAPTVAELSLIPTNLIDEVSAANTIVKNAAVEKFTTSTTPTSKEPQQSRPNHPVTRSQSTASNNLPPVVPNVLPKPTIELKSMTAGLKSFEVSSSIEAELLGELKSLDRSFQHDPATWDLFNSVGKPPFRSNPVELQENEQTWTVKKSPSGLHKDDAPNLSASTSIDYGLRTSSHGFGKAPIKRERPYEAGKNVSKSFNEEIDLSSADEESQPKSRPIDNTEDDLLKDESYKRMYNDEDYLKDKERPVNLGLDPWSNIVTSNLQKDQQASSPLDEIIPSGEPTLKAETLSQPKKVVVHPNSPIDEILDHIPMVPRRPSITSNTDSKSPSPSLTSHRRLNKSNSNWLTSGLSSQSFGVSLPEKLEPKVDSFAKVFVTTRTDSVETEDEDVNRFSKSAEGSKLFRNGQFHDSPMRKFSLKEDEEIPEALALYDEADRLSQSAIVSAMSLSNPQTSKPRPRRNSWFGQENPGDILGNLPRRARRKSSSQKSFEEVTVSAIISSPRSELEGAEILLTEGLDDSLNSPTTRQQSEKSGEESKNGIEDPNQDISTTEVLNFTNIMSNKTSSDDSDLSARNTTTHGSYHGQNHHKYMAPSNKMSFDKPEGRIPNAISSFDTATTDSSPEAKTMQGSDVPDSKVIRPRELFGAENSRSISKKEEESKSHPSSQKIEPIISKSTISGSHSSFSSGGAQREPPRVPGNPALDKLYGMLAKVDSTSQGESANSEEEILNVTVLDGVPYITMQPKKYSNEGANRASSSLHPGTSSQKIPKNDFDTDDNDDTPPADPSGQANKTSSYPPIESLINTLERENSGLRPDIKVAARALDSETTTTEDYGEFIGSDSDEEYDDDIENAILRLDSRAEQIFDGKSLKRTNSLEWSQDADNRLIKSYPPPQPEERPFRVAFSMPDLSTRLTLQKPKATSDDPQSKPLKRDDGYTSSSMDDLSLTPMERRIGSRPPPRYPSNIDANGKKAVSWSDLSAGQPLEIGPTMNFGEEPASPSPQKPKPIIKSRIIPPQVPPRPKIVSKSTMVDSGLGQTMLESPTSPIRVMRRSSATQTPVKSYDATTATYSPPGKVPLKATYVPPSYAPAVRSPPARPVKLEMKFEELTRPSASHSIASGLTSSLGSLFENRGPATPDSAASVAQYENYKTKNHLSDLKFLVKERDRVCDTLEGTEGMTHAVSSSMIAASPSTQRRCGRFHKKVNSAKSDLDSRIDETWRKLRDSKLEGIPTQDMEWILGVSNSADLTLGIRTRRFSGRDSSLDNSSPLTRTYLTSSQPNLFLAPTPPKRTELSEFAVLDYHKKLAELRMALVDVYKDMETNFTESLSTLASPQNRASNRGGLRASTPTNQTSSGVYSLESPGDFFRQKRTRTAKWIQDSSSSHGRIPSPIVPSFLQHDSSKLISSTAPRPMSPQISKTLEDQRVDAEIQRLLTAYRNGKLTADGVQP